MLQLCLEMKFTAILALLVALVATVFAQKELNQKAFDAEIGGNNNVFVKFFAPWCKSNWRELRCDRSSLTLMFVNQAVTASDLHPPGRSSPRSTLRQRSQRSTAPSRLLFARPRASAATQLWYCSRRDPRLRRSTRAHATWLRSRLGSTSRWRKHIGLKPHFCNHLLPTIYSNKLLHFWTIFSYLLSIVIAMLQIKAALKACTQEYIYASAAYELQNLPFSSTLICKRIFS